MQKACRMASYMPCRTLLEIFGKEFVKKHRKKAFQNVCNCSLYADSTISEIFTHFEVCMAVTSEDKIMLGDKLCSNLQYRGYQLPTTGCLVSAYSKLTQELRTSDILKDDVGRVIVPYDLDLPLKRFWVQFLLTDSQEVVILDYDGHLREPRPEEIIAPPSFEKPRRKKSKLT